jgi:uncharacterized protein YbaA (DUF1428 family)
MAQTAGEVWMEHGALSYVECIADDVPYGELTSFPRAVQQKDGETVIFAWITYESREARDAINEKVMGDPQLKDQMDIKDAPFDGKRMIYGGFQSWNSRRYSTAGGRTSTRNRARGRPRSSRTQSRGCC